MDIKLKLAEELIEHNPALAKAGAKMLEESGILGGALKLVTKEAEKLAGNVEVRKVLSTITHIFENEIPFESHFVKGNFAKSITVCPRKFYTIENPSGITQLKNLSSGGSGMGMEVLKHKAAPHALVEQYPHLAEKGVPNWFEGSDDWLYYQANKNFPTKVVLNDAGKLHAIEYQDEVMAIAGPFKGLTGKRFEISELTDGTKMSKMHFLGGRHLNGHHDEYEYLSGTSKIQCRDFAGAGKRLDVNEKIPEDIQGFEHWVARDYWKF
ncbi:MAG: hypothetical protein K2Y22_16780 [Candidatus Obscuribacterales bacterium]|nr:hypothetical protein [Candidatus Obscuribacterales bacterium]